MKQDIRILLEQTRKGNGKAFEKLVEKYTPLIKSLLAKYTNSSADSSDKDEMYQEACIALFHAAKTFDSSQEHVVFGLYAKICIRNRLISILRKRSREKIYPEYEKIEEADPLDVFISSENIKELKTWINSCLTEYEKSVLGLYLVGKNRRQIAVTLNKTEKSTDNAIYRIRTKLKKFI